MLITTYSHTIIYYPSNGGNRPGLLSFEVSAGCSQVIFTDACSAGLTPSPARWGNTSTGYYLGHCIYFYRKPF